MEYFSSCPSYTATLHVDPQPYVYNELSQMLIDTTGLLIDNCACIELAVNEHTTESFVIFVG